MTGVRAAFTEKELEFMRTAIGLELSDTRDYSDDELLVLFDRVTDELPLDLDDEGRPLARGWLFGSIVDKFLALLDDAECGAMKSGDKHMKVKYVGVSFGIDSLTDQRVYEVLEYDSEIGALRLIDDSGEDYLYSPVHPRPIADPSHPGGRFEIIEDDEQGSLHSAIYG